MRYAVLLAKQGYHLTFKWFTTRSAASLYAERRKRRGWFAYVVMR